MPQRASAQFLYGITNNGGIYEIDIAAKSTSLAFTTNLSLMNGFAFSETGDAGNGQAFYRNGSGTTNGLGDFYVWNRRTNSQTKIAVPTNIISGGKLIGQSSNASWYNGAYWYVAEGTDTLHKVSVSFADPNAPVVSAHQAFTNFDGTSATTFAFGDISISNGVLYGSNSNRFFKINLVNDAPSSATYQQYSMTAGSQLQIGFAGNPSILYGTAAATGEWYTVSTANGARTSLNFTTRDASNNVIAFNDISEGSLRSVDAVVQPEPGSAALLVPLAPLVACFWRRRNKR